MSFSNGRSCGLVFAGTMIDALSANTSPLLPAEERATELEQETEFESQSLQPDEPNDTQTRTYATFCRSVFESCSTQVTCPWELQRISFSAQGGTSSAEARQDRGQHPDNPIFQGKGQDSTRVTGGVDTDPIITQITQSIAQKQIRVLAGLFLETCPRDWSQGQGVAFHGLLRGYVRGDTEDVAREEEVAAAIQYRWEVALLADYMVLKFSLPVPNRQMCILWDPFDWWHHHKPLRPRNHRVWQALLRGGVWVEAADNQGPPFVRPLSYLAAAILEGTTSEEQADVKIVEMVAFVEGIKDFYKQRVLEDPAVLHSGGEWLRSIGRNIRNVSNPSQEPTASSLTTA